MAAQPEEIHPEHERPTPENFDEWTDEQIDAWNSLQEQRLDKEVKDQRRERDAETQEALEALRDPEEEDTAEVELGQTTLTVKTTTNAKVEQLLERLERNRDDADVQRRFIPQVIAWFVESPEEYTEPDIWREYAREFGRPELAIVMLRVIEPTAERTESEEVVRRFRDRASGSAPSSGE